MSWLRIDDSFEDHPKVDSLSDAAHRLWVRAACWCRKPTNAHTFGFVPRGRLRTIAKNSASPAQLEKLAQELVDATGDGMFEHGLWEVVEGGWRFHDWADYQPEDDEERIKAKRSEAGRKGAAARWAGHKQSNASANGNAHGKTDGTASSTASFANSKPMAKNAPDPVPIEKVVVGAGEALPSEIQAKARKVLENPHDGQYLSPSKWPEVQAIAKAWTQPFGIREPKLRDFPDGDSDLKAILAALADGYPLADLVSAGEKAKASEFFGQQQRPGPASFTAAVLRRLLADEREKPAENYMLDAEGRLVQ